VHEVKSWSAFSLTLLFPVVINILLIPHEKFTQ
jgi:hypothetical protein